MARSKSKQKTEAEKGQEVEAENRELKVGDVEAVLRRVFDVASKLLNASTPEELEELMSEDSRIVEALWPRRDKQYSCAGSARAMDCWRHALEKWRREKERDVVYNGISANLYAISKAFSLPGILVIDVDEPEKAGEFLERLGIRPDKTFTIWGGVAGGCNTHAECGGNTCKCGEEARARKFKVLVLVRGDLKFRKAEVPSAGIEVFADADVMIAGRHPDGVLYEVQEGEVPAIPKTKLVAVLEEFGAKTGSRELGPEPLQTCNQYKKIENYEGVADLAARIMEAAKAQGFERYNFYYYLGCLLRRACVSLDDALRIGELLYKRDPSAGEYRKEQRLSHIKRAYSKDKVVGLRRIQKLFFEALKEDTKKLFKILGVGPGVPPEMLRLAELLKKADGNEETFEKIDALFERLSPVTFAYLIKALEFLGAKVFYAKRTRKNADIFMFTDDRKYIVILKGKKVVKKRKNKETGEEVDVKGFDFDFELIPAYMIRRTVEVFSKTEVYVITATENKIYDGLRRENLVIVTTDQDKAADYVAKIARLLGQKDALTFIAHLPVENVALPFGILHNEGRGYYFNPGLLDDVKIEPRADVVEFAKWIRGLKEAYEDPTPVLAFVGYYFADGVYTALTKEKSGLRKETPLLYIYGDRNRGKTTLARMLTSLAGTSALNNAIGYTQTDYILRTPARRNNLVIGSTFPAIIDEVFSNESATRVWGEIEPVVKAIATGRLETLGSRAKTRGPGYEENFPVLRTIYMISNVLLTDRVRIDRALLRRFRFIKMPRLKKDLQPLWEVIEGKNVLAALVAALNDKRFWAYFKEEQERQRARARELKGMEFAYSDIAATAYALFKTMYEIYGHPELLELAEAVKKYEDEHFEEMQDVEAFEVDEESVEARVRNYVASYRVRQDMTIAQTLARMLKEPRRYEVVATKAKNFDEVVKRIEEIWKHSAVAEFVKELCGRDPRTLDEIFVYEVRDKVKSEIMSCLGDFSSVYFHYKALGLKRSELERLSGCFRRVSAKKIGDTAFKEQTNLVFTTLDCLVEIVLAPRVKVEEQAHSNTISGGINDINGINNSDLTNDRFSLTNDKTQSEGVYEGQVKPVYASYANYAKNTPIEKKEVENTVPQVSARDCIYLTLTELKVLGRFDGDVVEATFRALRDVEYARQLGVDRCLNQQPVSLAVSTIQLASSNVQVNAENIGNRDKQGGEVKADVLQLSTTEQDKTAGDQEPAYRKGFDEVAFCTARKLKAVGVEINAAKEIVKKLLSALKTNVEEARKIAKEHGLEDCL